MKSKKVVIHGQEVELVIHFYKGEEAEVYAIHDGVEIEFAYDVESMIEKLTNHSFLAAFADEVL